VCFSLERHRLAWLFLVKHSPLFDMQSRRLLHIAPEEILTTRFRRIAGIEYLSADLADPRAMVQMDITDIRYPDASFDVIFCSHVLEHVPNDAKAMREMYRVLSQQGWAVIEVPIGGAQTVEDLSIVDPEVRKRLYGHAEHVRFYGLDLSQRLEAAGFSVKIFTARDLVPEDRLEYYGLPAAQTLFYASKSKI
jgi:SAM-dependent methyltransferase